MPFQFLNEQLHNYDIIISATSSADYVVTLKDVQNAMKKRRGSPMVMMDIAVPRDIDPEVRKIDNVFYHDMDSLKIIVDQNLQKRKDQLPSVNKIIMEEMIGFFGWYNSLDVVPTIKTMRSFFEEIRSNELEKIKHKLSDDDFAKVDDMTRRMIGRLLHNPTVKLREYAETGSNIKEVTNNTVILKELFNLADKNGNGKTLNGEKKIAEEKVEEK